jgi:YD repeat-containing protein
MWPNENDPDAQSLMGKAESVLKNAVSEAKKTLGQAFTNPETIIQPDGATIHYDYDDQDQLIGMVDAEQGRWFKEYDGSGNIIKEIDPLKRETKYNYNAMGLPIQITDAKGGSKQLKYDDQGNLISYTDCSGKETKWEYDLRGRVTSVENALKNKVEYFYSDFTAEKREPLEQGLPLNSFGQLEKIKYSDVLEEHFIFQRCASHLYQMKSFVHFQKSHCNKILPVDHEYFHQH